MWLFTPVKDHDIIHLPCLGFVNSFRFILRRGFVIYDGYGDTIKVGKTNSRMDSHSYLTCVGSPTYSSSMSLGTCLAKATNYSLWCKYAGIYRSLGLRFFSSLMVLERDVHCLHWVYFRISSLKWIKHDYAWPMEVSDCLCLFMVGGEVK